jgi:hypothetical protein
MYQCMRHAVLLHHTRRNLYFVSWFTCSCLSIDICSNSNISTSDVAHKHGLTRSLFIEVPVPCKDSERSLMEVNSTMVSVLVSTAVDCEFDLRSGQGNDYEIGICFFSAKHATLRRKNTDWLARNQAIVSESLRGLLFQWARTKTFN